LSISRDEALWWSGDFHRYRGGARGRGPQGSSGGDDGSRIRQAPGSVLRPHGGLLSLARGQCFGRVRGPVEGARPYATTIGRLEDRRPWTDPRGCARARVRAGRCMVAAVGCAMAFARATAVVLRGGRARSADRRGSQASELHDCNQQRKGRRYLCSGHPGFIHHFRLSFDSLGDSPPRDNPGERTDVRKEGGPLLLQKLCQINDPQHK